MLHAKLQDHRTLGSEEEDFKAKYEHGSHLGHVTKTIFTKFMFTLHLKFDFDWPCGFRQKDI